MTAMKSPVTAAMAAMDAEDAARAASWRASVAAKAAA